MSDELFQNIVENQNSTQENEIQTEDSGTTWLVFKAGDSSYAIESSEIKEILRNNYVFPLPFVPPYIKGVLNYYGNPYAVVDFSVFQGYSPLSTSLFLVLKNENQFAFQISEIDEFHTKNDCSVEKIFTATDNGCFNSAISFENTTAPILNIENLITRIQSDLENC